MNAKTANVACSVLWALLGVDRKQPVVAVDLLALHLAVLVIIFVKSKAEDIMEALGNFPPLLSCVRIMSPATRATELAAAVKRATKASRATPFDDQEVAKERILDLNDRLHEALLSLELNQAVLTAAGVSPTLF